MSCVRHAFLLVIATAMSVTGSAAAADSSATPSPAASVPANTAERPAILAAPVTPATSEEPRPANRPRAISPATAAQLSAAVAKLEPTTPAPRPTAPAVSDPSVDLREIDRPRNTIIRLPNYLVREEKPVILNEREIRTPRARLALALNKYPGLRLGSFWIFRNDGIALAMLAEEERLQQKQYFEDLVQLTHFSDPGIQATAKKEVQHAFLREADFGR